MRAGPLSNDKVITLLNRHFVPVYAVNEEYRKGGAAPAEERAEYDRIYRTALSKKLPAGTVHAYVLTTAGEPVDSMHVAEAARTERCTALLERCIEKLKAPAGEPLVRPAPRSLPPRREGEALVLHLTARTLGAGWNDFPAEDWIVLERSEWARFLPAEGAQPGESWMIAPPVARKLLTHFYPQTENNDVEKNRFDRELLAATLLPAEGGTARVRLAGQLLMKHTFYPGREDDRFVEAKLLGRVEFDPGSRRIRSLALATEEATYGREKFAAALRSVID